MEAGGPAVGGLAASEIDKIAHRSHLLGGETSEGENIMLKSALAAVMLAGFVPAGVAAAQPATAPSTRAPCFFVTQWQGWSSPRPDIIYLGVNNDRDVYEVTLSGGGSPMLSAPATHLVSIVRGGSSICSSLDLDLKIADTSGAFVEPLIASGLRRLSPEEVAAIPPKYRPH